MTLMHLKSGTDIRGTAVGENITLTDEAIKRITSAFLVMLKEKTTLPFDKMTVAVGHDSRISANRIKKNVISVLEAENVKVLDCSLSSTPAMFMAVISLPCTASVQITASHHPFDKNGLKFFTKDGGFESEDITKLLKIAENIDIPECKEAISAEKIDFMSSYAAVLRKMICVGINSEDYEKPLKDFHIITDAGNGAGGFYAENVLKELGADITGSLFLEPDGYFPNHVPNPENKEVMSFISNAVIKEKADLGIVFDTDVDRAACVDRDGMPINRDRLVALASVIALKNNKGGVIVTDSVTSDGLAQFIKEAGGAHHRFKRGYKNVINEAIRLNNEGKNAPLAIETSGHAAFRENYFLDDGAYLITKIIILFAKLKKEGKDLSDVIKTLKMPLEETERRYAVNTENFKEYGENVLTELLKFAESQEGWTVAPDNRDGIRISADEAHGSGWFLLRQSVHDPVLPFNAQSNKKGGIDIILKAFTEFISKYEALTLL